MKVYIAGPMRGIADWNFPAFDEAERAWRRAGHHPMTPAQTTRALGYVPTDVTCSRRHLQHVMSVDMACIYACDAIALLPGWEQSIGATVEVALAQWLSLPIYDAIAMVELAIPMKPWSLKGASYAATG